MEFNPEELTNTMAYLYGAYQIYAIISGVLSFLLMILYIVARWNLFKKAGEHGWASIVPFYNQYVIYKIGMNHGWYFLLQIIPVVGIILSIVLKFKLSKAFGKGVLFGFGLLFFPLIFMSILGFGSSEYNPDFTEYRELNDEEKKTYEDYMNEEDEEPDPSEGSVLYNEDGTVFVKFPQEQ